MRNLDEFDEAGRQTDCGSMPPQIFAFSFTNIHKGNFPDLSACFACKWKELDSLIASLKSEV